jgi:hypothetical protein
MGFNKIVVGKNKIKEIESDLNLIRIYKKYDAMIFESNEIRNKFKFFENEYNQKKVIG